MALGASSGGIERAMMHFEIMLIASMVAIACAIPGTFLVLKKWALLSDAIAHSILLGIVLAFWVTNQIQSPLSMLFAVAIGMATVWGSESLVRSKLIKEDAAIGLIFPVFFSLAVILAFWIGKNTHLDQDAVLLGELALAPLRRLVWAGVDWGPVSGWYVGVVMMLSIIMTIRFFRPLSVTLFDPLLSKAVGLSPGLGMMGLMMMVSLTTVVSYDAVGSILVVCLMVTPACIALLITRELKRVLIMACVVGVVAAVLGYWVAVWLDATIAGSIAGTLGVLFLLTFIFSPLQGVWSHRVLMQQEKIEFACKILVVHLYSHAGTVIENQENTIEHMGRHMNWDIGYSNQVIQFGLARGYVEWLGDHLNLTALGREWAKSAFSLT